MSSPTTQSQDSPPQLIQSQDDSPPPQLIQSQDDSPPPELIQSQDSPPQIIQSQDSQPHITQSQQQSPIQSQDLSPQQLQQQPQIIQSQPQTPPSPPTAIPTQNPPPQQPPTSPPPPPPIIQALSYSPLKKPQPIPWSHEETINLIKAYQEKWYSLKRGQLKASQWEEVAITIAARCGLDEPSKSGTQCRHKIEKLRKRYRAEKQKLPPNFNYHKSHHPWIYYSLMDQLERGPMPISAIAPTTISKKNEENEDEEDEDEDDEEERGDVRYASLRKLKGENSNSRDFEKRVDGFFRIGKSNLGDFGNGFGKRSDFESGSFRDLKKRKNFYGNNDDFVQENQGVEEDDNEGELGRRKRGNLVGELAAEIRGFAEKFVRIEKKKLDLMRENERFRNEMENKRMEMIYVSQQRTVELINKAFDVVSSSSSTHNKKMKMNSEF